MMALGNFNLLSFPEVRVGFINFGGSVRNKLLPFVKIKPFKPMSFLDSFFGSNPQEQNSVKKLPAAEFLVAVLDTTVQLIDVRTQREYDNGHIRGALNIDWFQPLSFKKSIRKLDRKQPIYVYCRTGNRSQKATRKLTKLGFTQIYDLKGGITAVE